MESTEKARQIALVVCFCLTAFLGAFLLFQLEPVVGKLVTPRYGGTASVWTICLLFFQSVVLVGYTLTYTITKLPARIQLGLYLLLMAFSLLWSTVPSGASWQVGSYDQPALNILIALMVHVAIPCILLSTVSGVLQVWFGLANLGNPYPLYSVSNIGSIAALIAYPTLIEPNFTLTRTLHFWSWAYWILAATAVLCALIVWFRTARANPNETIAYAQVSTDTAPKTGARNFFWWMFLSTMGSSTLLSYSNYITSDISPTPMLWVLPLAIYLLTFALVFGNLRLYRRDLLLKTWMIFCAIEPLCAWIAYPLALLVNLILVFELCMICHGELATSKPGLSQLPVFYLAIAIGGALGGIFVGIIAPSLFSFEAERFFVIVIMGLLTVYELAIKKFQQSNKKNFARIFLALVTLATLVAWLKLKPENLVYRERNFYSAARVQKETDCMVLYHGRVNHGQQFLDPAKSEQAAGLYYGLPLALVADFMHHVRNGASVSFAGVGLGVGTFAVYGRPGDSLTFYELDPKVKRIAEQFFTYLAKTKAKAQVLVGDGRMLLDASAPQNYDLMLIDAFNGDAIPCHLLTKQALTIYLKHMKYDGLLAFHTTNRYVDLAPVLGNLAKDLNLKASSIRYVNTVTYVVMSKDANQIDQLVAYAKEHQAAYPKVEIYPTPLKPSVGVWTDDFTNLVNVLKIF